MLLGVSVLGVMGGGVAALAASSPFHAAAAGLGIALVLLLLGLIVGGYLTWKEDTAMLRHTLANLMQRRRSMSGSWTR